MDENNNKTTKHKIQTSSPLNKKSFDGITNSNFSSFIKTKNLRLNYQKINGNRNNKIINDRKKLSSALFKKRYNLDKLQQDYYNSNKKIQANNNKKNPLYMSILNISTPYNKENALYKNLSSELINKNFGKTTKSVNLNLYKSITTNYLNQKESNNIPILYPFYSTYEHKYNSKSQRERYIKNLDKLIQVKTHLSSNKTDHFKIISEFMIKNGVYEKKYINSDSMMKIENFLKKPLNLIPNLTMTQIIKRVVDSRPNKITKNSESKNMIFNYENYFESKKSRNKSNQLFQNIKTSKNSIKFNNFNKSNSTTNFSNEKFKDDSRLVKLGKKFSYLFDKENPSKLISSLENELKTLKMGKISKFEENNKVNDNEIYLMKSFEDNNKFVPNLCLSSQGFSEKYKNNIIKYNNKLKNKISKNEKIRDINRRMYYDSKKNKNLKEFDLSDVRKYHKITELVVLNKRKKELLNKKLGDMNFASLEKNLKNSFLNQKNN